VIATLVFPDPRDCDGVDVKEARLLSVPHSNQPVVANSFGLTVPCNVAPVVVTLSAALVVTVGGEFGKAVVKLAIAPFCVPEAFVAATR
jgi:hypothetical protein